MDSQTTSNSEKVLGPEKMARLGWILALILLGVSLFLAFRLADVRTGITFGEVREQIRTACTTPGDQNEADCRSGLQEMYALLSEIQTIRANPGAAGGVPTEGSNPVAPTATATPVI